MCVNCGPSWPSNWSLALNNSPSRTQKTRFIRPWLLTIHWLFVADAKKIFNIRGQWTEEKLDETMADIMVNGESAKRSAVSLLMVGPIPRLALQRRTKKATTRPNFVPAVHQEARPHSSGARWWWHFMSLYWACSYSETADDWSRCHYGSMHRAALERLLTIITVSVKTATNLALTYHNVRLIVQCGFSET